MKNRIMKIVLVIVCLVATLTTLTTQPTFAETNAGCVLTWQYSPSPTSSDANYVLNAVDANTSGDVWAVGQAWRPSANREDSLVEHWNGTAWSVVASPNVANKNNELVAVTALAGNDVWAVGKASDNSGNQILIEHWNGTAWSIVPGPDLGSGSGELLSVDGAAANDVWAVGDQNATTLLLHWDGSSWQQVTAPTGGQYSRVVAKATNDVWALGHDSLTAASVVHWNGSTWSVANTLALEYGPNPYDTRQGVLDLQVSSASEMWIVGWEVTSRTIQSGVRWHWDGANWTTGAFNTGGWAWDRIAGTQADNLWGIGKGFGDASRVAQWDGTDWKTYVLDSAVGTYAYKGIAAVSNDEFWLVGGAVTGTTPVPAAIVHGTLPCRVPPTAAPTLDAPAEGATLHEIKPTFLWSAVGDTEFYTLELFQHQITNPAYAILNTKETQLKYSYLVGLMDGIYYWHVHACNYVGCSAWSAMRSFTMEASAPVAAPTLIAPANGTLTAESQMAFAFSAVENTLRYTIEIYRGSTDGSPAYALTYFITTPTVYDITGSGQFYWRVQGCNDGGCGAWSEWGMFGHTVPDYPPNLLAPNKNEVVHTARPNFEWHTMTFATRYILQLRKGTPNGEKMGRINTKKTHTQWTRNLANGPYYWRVRACSDLSCGNWSKARKFVVQNGNP